MQKPDAEEVREAGRALGKSGRGFASMSLDENRRIASMGGKTAHELGKAHKFTSEEAREAGRKGGLALGRKNRNQT